MKVKTIKDGAVKTVNDSYGARLIEQGKAIFFADTPKKGATAKKAVDPKAGGDS